ncbi:hypothetical protein NQ315_017138 [Exocentrus adspersus]|uniref:YqaJ viral recombinase domain-containing protein n=1 Tax=Exocentrus adspersus TaxID=1586481 RepID=A0AAV8VBL7_9CUCU|nr:hypothetical protein NQ315_017138 [Exocentrus adspersus]
MMKNSGAEERMPTQVDIEIQPAIVKGDVQASVHRFEGTKSDFDVLHLSKRTIPLVSNASGVPTTSGKLDDDLGIMAVEQIYSSKQYTAIKQKILESKVEDFRRKSSDKELYFLQKCSLPLERIIEIAGLTVGQHKNENWLISRKSRLTASKFGYFLKAAKRDKYPQSLFKSLLEGYSLDRVLAVQWGKDNEGTAITKFMDETGFSVVPTGLWLHECGFLGASPDGLIDHDCILEVKCPYKFRNISIRDGVKDKNYLFHYDDDEILVDCEHNECVIIDRDEDWISNIDILKDFYLRKFLPVLVK